MKNIVYAIGEALIDFIPSEKGRALKEVVSFERVAGGAPANVAAVVSKLGGKSAFISQLGKDAFGDYIVEQLTGAGVDCSNVLRTSKANTGLAFVSLKEDGNRDFSFYRNPSADMLLTEEDIKEECLKDCHTLHFCSVDLIEAPIKYAHKKAINIAKQNGSIVSFDPNVRLPLWDSEDNCRKAIREFLPLANIVKISDEELEFITGYSTIEEAKKVIFAGDCKILIYTKGGDGAELHTEKFSVSINGIKVNAIDTTGAGDSFIGSFLYNLSVDNVSLADLDKLTEDKLRSYLVFSNYYACNTTTKKGAIGSMATKEEIDEYIGGF